jgi:hypothetical protein
MKSFNLVFATTTLFFFHAASSSAATRTFGPESAAPASSGFSAYQNPDGSYSSLSALVRDINGTPCGIECEQDADRRWGARPQHEYYGLFPN